MLSLVIPNKKEKMKLPTQVCGAFVISTFTAAAICLLKISICKQQEIQEEKEGCTSISPFISPFEQRSYDAFARIRNDYDSMQKAQETSAGYKEKYLVLLDYTIGKDVLNIFRSNCNDSTTVRWITKELFESDFSSYFGFTYKYVWIVGHSHANVDKSTTTFLGDEYEDIDLPDPKQLQSNLITLLTKTRRISSIVCICSCNAAQSASMKIACQNIHQVLGFEDIRLASGAFGRPLRYQGGKAGEIKDRLPHREVRKIVARRIQKGYITKHPWAFDYSCATGNVGGLFAIEYETISKHYFDLGYCLFSFPSFSSVFNNVGSVLNTLSFASIQAAFQNNVQNESVNMPSFLVDAIGTIEIIVETGMTVTGTALGTVYGAMADAYLDTQQLSGFAVFFDNIDEKTFVTLWEDVENSVKNADIPASINELKDFDITGKVSFLYGDDNALYTFADFKGACDNIAVETLFNEEFIEHVGDSCENMGNVITLASTNAVASTGRFIALAQASIEDGSFEAAIEEELNNLKERVDAVIDSELDAVVQLILTQIFNKLMKVCSVTGLSVESSIFIMFQLKSNQYRDKDNQNDYESLVTFITHAISYRFFSLLITILAKTDALDLCAPALKFFNVFDDSDFTSDELAAGDRLKAEFVYSMRHGTNWMLDLISGMFSFPLDDILDDSGSGTAVDAIDNIVSGLLGFLEVLEPTSLTSEMFGDAYNDEISGDGEKWDSTILSNGDIECPTNVINHLLDVILHLEDDDHAPTYAANRVLCFPKMYAGSNVCKMVDDKLGEGRTNLRFLRIDEYDMDSGFADVFDK